MRRYRIVLLALAVSAVLHAAVMVGMPRRLDKIDQGTEAIYSATLDALATPAVIAPPPPPAATATPVAPRPARPRAPRAHPAVAAKPVYAFPEEMERDAPPAPVIEPMAALAPTSRPDVRPIEELAPLPDAAAIEAARESFPVEAMPASFAIDYALSSAFADGRAVYRWTRDGDSYRITGEAQAEGFFALFLEGQIVQETQGTVTAAGLRPERFTERKPGSPAEGLEFDWASQKVTFDRNGTRKTDALQDNTVDWLSMIFQLAHRPPQGPMDLRVFTQRKLYTFRLQVVGTEEIQIPLGKVRALHLRHVDEKDAKEVVDVWLGVDQHYVPVKLRFPVAKNRLMVEQVATRVSER